LVLAFELNSLALSLEKKTAKLILADEDKFKFHPLHISGVRVSTPSTQVSIHK